MVSRNAHNTADSNTDIIQKAFKLQTSAKSTAGKYHYGKYLCHACYCHQLLSCGFPQCDAKLIMHNENSVLVVN